MRLGHSLRGRLTLSMGLVLCIGLGVVAGLHSLEDGKGIERQLGRLLLGDELPEPWQDLAVLLPFGGLMLLLVGVVCRWTLRPLLRASMEASEVGPHNPGRRIGTRDLPEELSPLVVAMNAALDRLADAYEVERRFTMNAAHELRTPLATLRLRLQRVRHDDAPLDWLAIERDIAGMSGRIDRLLDLARKQAAEAGIGRAGEIGPMLDFSRVVRAAAAQMLPLVEAAQRELALELPEPSAGSLGLRGDAVDLQDMVRNLIENALHHGVGRIGLRATAGGVRRRAGKAGGGRTHVTLDVSDEGPGVPEELRQMMFERFRKGRQASSGSGLGLAIVQEVVQRHGGSVGFIPGPHCIVRVLLPVTPEPAS